MSIIQVWGEGRDALWTPGGPVRVPHSYDYLPAGDTHLTRAVKKAIGGDRLFVVMKRVSKRYPPKRAGMWAPGSVIAAERQRLADLRTDEHKERLVERRKRQQEREIAVFCTSIRQRFPGCPAEEAREIAEHTCEVGSGRVGRSSVADDPVRAAAVAHIRHKHTEYDELLDTCIEGWMGFDDRQMARDYARKKVRGQIDEILLAWEAPAASLEVRV
jgi:hypothetical protein